MKNFKRLARKMTKKASGTDLVVIRNCATDEDFVLEVDDDIEDKIYEITNDGENDYEIIGNLTEIECTLKDIDDLLILQEICQDDTVMIEAINAYLDNYSKNLGDAYKAASDCYYIRANNPYDLAYEYIAELGGLEAIGQETVERYFDYEAYGKDMEYDFCYYDDYYFDFN